IGYGLYSATLEVEWSERPSINLSHFASAANGIAALAPGTQFGTPVRIRVRRGSCMPTAVFARQTPARRQRSLAIFLSSTSSLSQTGRWTGREGSHLW